ncbi:MAG: hypothetical protein WD651_01345 [Acidimicrobiia bacterium]
MTGGNSKEWTPTGLHLMTQRAEEYLRDPTEARLHAMDPANLAVSLG